MRKKSIILPLFLLALSALAGCGKSSREPVVDEQPIRLRATSRDVETYVGVETSARSGAVEGAYLPESGTVGVYVVTNDGSTHGFPPTSGNAYLLNNVQGTAGVPVAGQTITLPTTPKFYYTSGQQHDFYAYYPYNAGTIGAAAADNAPTVTTTLTSTNQPDLMWATPVKNISSTQSTPVMLTFNHALSLLRFNIIKNAAIDDKLTLDELRVTTSTSQTVTMNIATGAITTSGSGSSYCAYSPVGGYIIGTTTPAAPLTAFLYTPFSQITEIALTIDGVTCRTDDAFSFATLEAGKARVVNIEVKPVEIAIKIGEQDWKDGESIGLSEHSVQTSIKIGDAGWTLDNNTVTLR